MYPRKNKQKIYSKANPERRIKEAEIPPLFL